MVNGVHLSIRPTVYDDVQELARIQKEAFMPIYEKFKDKGNPALRGPEDISARLPMTKRFRYFTIRANNKIVGGILYRCCGNGIFFDDLQPGEYYLQRIYIDPSIQGKKIARTAIEMCETQFPDAKRFFVDFPTEMEQNQKCYEAAGFRDTGMRIEAEPGLILSFYKKEMSKKEVRI